MRGDAEFEARLWRMSAIAWSMIAAAAFAAAVQVVRGVDVKRK
jgi:hypothetical protein